MNVNQSLNLAIKLKTKKVPYKLIIYENEGHNIYQNKEELDKIILSWFSKYL